MREVNILRLSACFGAALLFFAGCGGGGSGGTEDTEVEDMVVEDSLFDGDDGDAADDPDAPDLAEDAGEDDSGPVTTYPDNILVNGGFEYGLQCYANWVWSQSGVDYRGDYDFWLSTDAHSGSYSLEMRCQGSDCGDGAKAAIYTQHIATPPGQAYRISLHARCASGSTCYLYVPQTSEGELFEYLECTGDWTQNELSFSAADDASTFRFYVYNASTESLFLDDMVLTYDDGSVPAQTLVHGGSRNVRIEGQAVIVDGVPYLALGFFNVPYEDLEQAASMGANTITGLGTELSSDCFNTERPSYLDHAHELGIGVAPDSTFSARLDEPAVFPSIMEQFSHHLAVVSWFLVDEPDQADVAWYVIEPSTLTAEYEAAKTMTRLPVLADFQRASWESASVIEPYADAVDFWMAEPYGSSFGGVVHAMDLFNSIERRPVWLAQDAVDADLVVPKAWWVVVQGATGILYFTWWEFSDDGARLAAATQAFLELGQLRDAVFGEVIDDQVTGPAGVGFMARRLTGQTYIMAVHPETGTATGDFSVTGLADAAEVTVLFEDRSITSSGGAFFDTFDGIARHVYLIE
jgi:hypothetical protein